jgi:hypothetical protein
MGEFTRWQRWALGVTLTAGIAGVILTSILFPGMVN